MPAMSDAFDQLLDAAIQHLQELKAQGIRYVSVAPERLTALKLKEEKGVEVTMVDQDAPAGKAGIKEHDVILTMNGTAIENYFSAVEGRGIQEIVDEPR